MEFMKKIYFRGTTQWIKLFMLPYGHNLYYHLTYLQILLTSILGFPLEQNSETSKTITPYDDTTPKMSYAGTRPKQRTAPALIPQLKPKEETAQRR